MGKPYNMAANEGLTDVCVGDGNHDGKIEAYFICCDDGKIYEFNYCEDGWSSRSIGAIADASMFGWTAIAFGDGDDDGLSELYVSGYYKSSPKEDYKFILCQFYYNGTAWKRTEIDTYPWLKDICVGDGDNDGKNELYGGNVNGEIYKYSKKGTLWDQQSIGAVPQFKMGANWEIPMVTGITLGDGDNDGKNEIYASTTNNHVYQFKYNGSMWNITKVGEGENNTWQSITFGMTDIALGDGDNDFNNEIYSISYINQTVYCFKYDKLSHSWGNRVIYTAGVMFIYDICIGDGNGDGKNEVYISRVDGQVLQLSYDAGTDSWNSIGVGSGSDAMNSIALASFYNDSINGIYGACADGHAYEFINDLSPPRNPVVTSDTHPVPGEWYARNVVHVMWADRGSDRSGIDGYSYVWDTNATTVPPALKSCEETVHDASSPVLPDGESYYFHIRARDNALNWNTTATHFGPIRIDTVPPDRLNIVINGGAPYTSSAEVELTLGARDPMPGSGLWRMAFSNDGIIYSNWTDWRESAVWSLTDGAGGTDSDGKKTVYFRVQDRAGNVGGPVNSSIFLDRRHPEQLGLMINDGAEFTNESIVSLTVMGQDRDPSSGISEMSIANSESFLGFWEPFTARKSNWSLVNGTGGTDTDGLKAVHLQVRDRAGNIGGPLNDTIFLDRVEPGRLSVVINNGAAYTTSRSVTLTLEADDPEPASGVYAMQLSDDGTGWSEWEEFTETKVHTLPAGDGLKTIYFRVRDRAGNIAGPATDTIVLDTIPPLISNVQVVGITDTSATVIWETSEEADSGVEWGLTGSYGSSLKDEVFATAHSLTLKGLSPSTTYHFRVSSRDRAGNPASYSGDYIFITAAGLDTIAPFITRVSVSGVTDRLAVISWVTNEPADSTVHYGLTTSYGLSVSESNFVLKHSIVLRELSPSTVYHFRVESRDPSGNGPARSGDYTFRTLSAPDTAPPIISSVRVSVITDRMAVVSWETDEPADSLVEYGTTAAYGLSVRDGRLVRLHEIRLSGLLPATTYHFRVMSRDATGNGPSSSEDMSFTTAEVPDTTPPVISGISIESVADVSAVVVWETDEPSDSFVEFGPAGSYGMTTADGALVLRHSLLLLGLRPDTIYHVRVRSSDASGNVATGPEISFRTRRMPAAPDITPPVISRVQVAGVSMDRVVVTWYTDELADSEVEFGNSTIHGLRASDPSHTFFHSLVLRGLSPSTQYYFRVLSTDIWGNGPSISPEFIFVTGAVPDTTPPVITDIVVVDITDTTAIIRWTTDEPSDSLVEFGPDIHYGRSQSSGVLVFNHSVQLVGLLPGTTYHFRVLSRDATGNWAPPSGDMTFRTLKGGPGPEPPGRDVVTVVGGAPWLVWVALALLLAGGAYIVIHNYIRNKDADGSLTMKKPGG